MLKESIRPALVAILSCSVVVNVGFGLYAYYHNFGLHLPGYQRPIPPDSQEDRSPIRTGMKAPTVLAKANGKSTREISFPIGAMPTV